MTKIEIRAANFISPIRCAGKNLTSANRTHPETRGWGMELVDGSLLLTATSGKQYLVFQSNIANLEVVMSEVKDKKSAAGKSS